MRGATFRSLLLLLVCAVALGVALAKGQTQGREALRTDLPAPAWHARWAGAAPNNPHGVALAAGSAARAGLDPLVPPGLPPGALVDPVTGYVQGLELAVEPGETHVPWSMLDPALPASGEAADLPTEVQGLEGRPVLLVGFVMPLYDPRDGREFLLLGSHFACCFGRLPGPGGLVRVRLDASAPDQTATLAPVQVRGLFRIDPLVLDGVGGPPVSLFRIEAARTAPLTPH